MKSDLEIINHIRRWVERFVVGLNLCPFARHPFRNDKIRYFVQHGDNLEAITETLLREINALIAENPSVLETTLIILPDALADFDDYLDYIEMAEFIVEKVELEGIVQVASFHPQYQFEDTEADDVENYTNRSPFPMLHLLREASVERAIEAFPEVGDIPEKNIETMNNLGLYRVKQMLDELD